MPGRAPRLYLPYAPMASDRSTSLGTVHWPTMTPSANAAGARLATATQNNYLFGWRRFLGFLAIHEPAALEAAPTERLTIERIRSFIAHLAETNSPRSVASQVDALYKAARVMMPEHDWTWFKAVKARLYRAAPRTCSNRAGHYQPAAARPWPAVDGREHASTGHSDQHGRCHPLPRWLDVRACCVYPVPAQESRRA